MTTWELRKKPLSAYAPHEFTGVPNYRVKSMQKIPNDNIRQWAVMVVHYLNGEPNNPDSRKILAENGLIEEGIDFAVIGNNIYPMWALLEAEELKKRFPQYFE